jgi:diguanylate cyclase (GGDEF)-like protein
MVVGIRDMYVGETAEIISIGGSDCIEIKRLRDMGIREGRLIDLITYDDAVNKKVVISIDNSRIALDIGLSAMIKVRPLKHYYEVVRSQAIFDSLTGCLNRHSIECILMREYEKFKNDRIPLSLLLADIDYFKRINDTYGHSAGDGVLKGISTLFKQVLRRSDCLCRWGGEEFLMLLRGTLIHDALQIAERLRQSVESNIFQPFVGSSFVTVSIGVCGLPPERDIEDIIKAADKALYDAKRNGRNRVNMCMEAL